jgi:hypothetical protein
MVTTINVSSAPNFQAATETLNNCTAAYTTHLGGIDSDGSRFVIVAGSCDGAFQCTGNFQVYATALGMNAGRTALVPVETRVAMSHPGVTTVTGVTAPRRISAARGGSPSPRYGIAGTFGTSAGTFQFFASYDGFTGSLPDPTRVRSNCGTLSLTMQGTGAVGELLNFSLSASGPGTDFLFGGPITVPLLGCTSCNILVQGVAIPNPLSIRVHNSPTLVGTLFAIQGFSLLQGPAWAACR